MSPQVVSEKEKPVVVAKNPANVKKAVSLGRDILKNKPDATKADVALAMFELLIDEPREIIAQAFVDGAGLTPKGAMTYFYNTKRKHVKASKQKPVV
jgi:hypothetical protein